MQSTNKTQSVFSVSIVLTRLDDNDYDDNQNDYNDSAQLNNAGDILEMVRILSVFLLLFCRLPCGFGITYYAHFHHIKSQHAKTTLLWLEHAEGILLNTDIIGNCGKLWKIRNSTVPAYTESTYQEQAFQAYNEIGRCYTQRRRLLSELELVRCWGSVAIAWCE